MRGNEGWSLLEDAFKNGGFVDQHVACGRPHEHLDATHVVGVGFEHLVQVVVARPHEEAVVHRAHLGGAVVLVLQQILGQRLRHRVGHFHERGDPTRRGCGRFGGDFRLVRQSGFTEMNLVVNASGHDPQPLAIHLSCSGSQSTDFAVLGFLGQVDPFGVDGFPHDQDVFSSDATIVDHVAISKQGGCAHEGKKMDLNLMLMTPMSASRKMFMLILDVPSSRSTKVMGTSLIPNPLRLARSFISI